MPFQMKIQPIDSQQQQKSNPPLFESGLKQLFDQPFHNLFKISSSAKTQMSPETTAEIENSSFSLDKLVQEYIEENAYDQKPAQINGCIGNDSSDEDETDLPSGEDSVTKHKSSCSDSIEKLKSLIPCATSMENNLLAEISKIVEENKSCKRKEDLRKAVVDGLLNLGFNASICKSKWKKSSSIVSGEYEYIDVIFGGERLLVDVDLRSEFEIARSTTTYQAILQSLPLIFVGKADRLLKIIVIVAAAARRSFKMNGMNVASWRKTKYIKSKWLGSYVRTTVANAGALLPAPLQLGNGNSKVRYGSGNESRVECNGGGCRVGFKVKIDAKKVEIKDVGDGSGDKVRCDSGGGGVGCDGDGGKVGVEVEADDDKVEIEDVEVERGTGDLVFVFDEETKLSEEHEAILFSSTRVSDGESSASSFIVVS